MFLFEAVGARSGVGVMQDKVAWGRPLVAPRVKAARKHAPGKFAIDQGGQKLVDDAFLDLARVFVAEPVSYFLKKLMAVTAANKETAVDVMGRNAGGLKHDVAIAQLGHGDVRSEPVNPNIDIGPNDDAPSVLTEALQNQVHFFTYARDKLRTVVMAFPKHLDDVRLHGEAGRDRGQKMLVIEPIV